MGHWYSASDTDVNGRLHTSTSVLLGGVRKKEYSRTSALAEDPYPSSSAAGWQPNRGWTVTYWEQAQGWYSGASGSGSWHQQTRWEQRANS